jgi:hypothetical protein
MAESIQLNVTLNENGVISSLTQIDSLLTRIRGSGAVKVKVSSTGLKTAAKDAQDLASKLNSAAAAAQQFNSNGPKGFTNTSQAAQNATQSAQQFGSTATQAFNSAGQAAQSASRNAISFNNGLTSVVGTMFKFRLASTAINLAISAIKDGVLLLALFASDFDEAEILYPQLIRIKPSDTNAKKGAPVYVWSSAFALGRRAKGENGDPFVFVPITLPFRFCALARRRPPLPRIKGLVSAIAS